MSGMRTLRTILIWLGFTFLVVSIGLALALADASTIFGGISWRCPAPTTDGTVECTVITGSSTLASLGLYSVSFPVVSALVGIGLLVGANTLGQSLAAQQVPVAPAAQAPAPQPYAQPQHRTPQPPPGQQYRG